jgi:hypothetical protein
MSLRDGQVDYRRSSEAQLLEVLGAIDPRRSPLNFGHLQAELERLGYVITQSPAGALRAQRLTATREAGLELAALRAASGYPKRERLCRIGRSGTPDSGHRAGDLADRLCATADGCTARPVSRRWRLLRQLGERIGQR